MTLETTWREPRVKAEIRRVLTFLRAQSFMPSASTFGRTGVCDHIVCLQGRYLAIEAKGLDSSGGGKLRSDQIEFGRGVLAAGGVWLVIDHTNVLRLPMILLSHGLGIGRWKGFKPCNTRSLKSTPKRKRFLQ